MPTQNSEIGARRLLIVADDLTGAVDTAAFVGAAGEPVNVAVDYRYMKLDVDRTASVNAGSRAQPADAAYRIHRDIGRSIETPHLLIKKMDMGLRGNAAADIAGLMSGLEAAHCFVVNALPEYNTYTLHGKQYVRGVILTESMYAADPIHKPASAVVTDYLSHTRIQAAHIHIGAARGPSLAAQVAELIGGGANTVVFDAVTQKDIDKIFNSLVPLYPDVLWAGTLGLVRAATRRFYGEMPPRIGPYAAKPQKTACFSGTAYPVTKAQIQYSAERGLQVVRLGMAQIIHTPSCREQVIRQVVDACVRACEKGNFILVPHVLPEDEFPGLDKLLLDVFSECACRVCGRAAFDRLAIIGGETAYALLQMIPARHIVIREMPEVSIASGVIQGGPLDGRGISIKGGSVGGEAALEKMMGRFDEL